LDIGNRIVEKRIEMGIKQSELANLVDLNPSTVSQIESGNRQPSLEALINIANVLRVSVDYLIKGKSKESTKNELDIDPKLAFISKGFSMLKEEAQRDLLDYYFFLLHKYNNKHFSKLMLSPSELATEIHNRYSNTLPIDVRKIAKELDIKVEDSFFDRNFDGCLMITPVNKKMIINSHINLEERRKFTIAHLLAHIVIPWHRSNFYECRPSGNSSILSEDIWEQEANDFAAELLMPSSYILKDLQKKKLSLTDIENLAHNKYKVSFTAAAVRLVKKHFKPCILLRLTNNLIKWTVKSNSFNFDIKYQFQNETLTSDINFENVDEYIDFKGEHFEVSKVDVKQFKNYGDTYILIELNKAASY